MIRSSHSLSTHQVRMQNVVNTTERENKKFPTKE